MLFKLKLMKNLLFLLLGLLMTTHLHAQFGINAAYRFNNAPDLKIIKSFDGTNDEFEVLSNGFSIGMDYWFRLKNYRIEFLPELNYGQYNRNLQTDDETIALKSGAASFFLNTNIYFLDLLGDCNCPTFSKQGPTINKGIFLQLSPGLTYWNQSYTSQSGDNEASNITFSIAAGLGVDIGITDLITLTPFGGLRYYPEIEWTDLSVITDEYFLLEVKAEKSSLMQAYTGIRIGIRLDHENY